MNFILEWPTPRSTTKVRSFYGLASFYRKFNRNLTNICATLTKSMRRNRKEFKWTTRAARSFELLKKKVIEQPVLSQEGKPISYFIENLNDAKKKYFVYD